MSRDEYVEENEDGGGSDEDGEGGAGVGYYCDDPGGETEDCDGEEKLEDAEEGVEEVGFEDVAAEGGGVFGWETRVVGCCHGWLFLGMGGYRCVIGI